MHNNNNTCRQPGNVIEAFDLVLLFWRPITCAAGLFQLFRLLFRLFKLFRLLFRLFRHVLGRPKCGCADV